MNREKMMKNSEAVIEGRIYKHNLSTKVTGPTSKSPNTPFITGSVDIATDDAGLNIVTVYYTYVTELTSKGKKNSNFPVLKSIIENGKTILEDGLEAATIVRATPSISTNDFYSERAITEDNPEGLVCATRFEGGFISILNKFSTLDEAKRNYFKCDVVVTNIAEVEADPERNIEEDYLKVSGFTISFMGAMVPVKFVLKNPQGINIFKSYEIGNGKYEVMNITGSFVLRTIKVVKEASGDEVLFGEAITRESSRDIKEWLITSANKPYEVDDTDYYVTPEEIVELKQKRTTYLADVKRRRDEYEASKAVSNATFGAAPASNGVKAAVGDFNALGF